MDCSDAGRVRKLLAGDLDDAATRDAYAHLRRCASCRDAVDFERSLRRAGARGDEEFETTAVSSAPARGFSSFLRPGGAADASRRRGRFALFASIAAILAVGGVLRRGGPSGDDSPEEFLRRTVARGLPATLGPSGPQDGRPRLVVAALPAPVAEARFLFVGPDGAPLATILVVPGRDGCLLEACEIVSPSGRLGAWRLAAPFPDEVAERLPAGAPCGASVLLPGGAASAAVAFTLR
ncbi:MAG TPA: hypothetical protein VEI02_13875 [Planctomycetota bacterium]|nr:hypothetical protein [Planctomycetota bacterium]